MVETTLDAFLAGVRERFGPRVAEIRLFGSYARGDATADSDVDCLVLLDQVDQDDDRAVARYRLEADYGRDFVLTDAALREDLDSCQGFLDRARSTIAGFLR